jgi:hypothetical protein
MKQYRYGTQILVLTILSFFLITCDDIPIFFTLEKAYKTSNDRGLEDTIGFEKIVWTGAEYFIHGQSVYKRDPGTSSTWHYVPPPASGAVCGGLEYFDTQIFAWFYNSVDQKPVGLYSRVPADPATDPWTGPITDPEWPIGSWPDDQFRVHFVKAVGTQLFVSTSVYDNSADTTTYNLYYSPDGTSDSFTASGGISTDNQILDVEYDLSSYWLITTPGVAGADNPTYLYEDTTPAAPDSFADRSQDPGVPAFWENGSDDPSGILYTADSLYYAPNADKLYLSGWHGRIFIHDAGAWSDWAILADADKTDRKTVKVGNKVKTVEFTAFVENPNANQIFVGSLQYGFFYFASDTLDHTSTLIPSDIVAGDVGYKYFPGELDDGGIRNFLVDTEDPGNIMFVCTAGAGLWRGDWGKEEPSDVVEKWIWYQE